MQKLTEISGLKCMEPQSSSEPSPATSLVTDGTLLQALQNQQMSALEMLYHRYGGVVYGMALKVLKTPHEAEDLAQEIFLALWHHPPNPDHPHLARYLVAMTRSRAIDKLRSRQRHFNLLQRWQQVAPLETASLYDQAVLTERAQQVRLALAELPEEHRQVIEMAYDQGLSQSEISNQLHAPLGTVKTWTRQGLLKLKQILCNTLD